MKRTTIFIPEALERRVQQFAKRADKSVASVVREALINYLELHRSAFILPPTFDSGRTDVSERLDDLMFAGFDVHGTPLAPPKSKRRA